MSKQKLLKMSEHLQQELSKDRVIDEDLWDRLVQVQEHIEEILAEPEAVTEHHRLSLIKKLRKIVDDFEISHPELTSKLGDMADSLSRMGF